MTKVEEQVSSIEEYVNAAADFNDAMTLLAEARVRVTRAIQANEVVGISKADPLRLLERISTGEPVEAHLNGRGPVSQVESQIVTNKREGEKRTKNSPRNSPGLTKKMVYEALPGDANVISKRTGLTKSQIWAAVADLLLGGLVERHGTRGNTTYTVKGDRVDWTAQQFAPVYEGNKTTT
jgi:hypothetical protein